MLSQLTSSQLTELEAMWAIESGWGDCKQDYRFACLESLTANINRSKDSKPYSPEDFVLRSDAKEHRSLDEGQQHIRNAFEKLSGIKGKKKGKKRKENNG